MGKEFESELGKRIVEGKTRKTPVKVGLVAAAVVSCALLFGTAAFSYAMGSGASAGSPPFMTEVVIWDHEVDEISFTEDGDADAKDVLSLKYKSSLPPGGADPGNTKLVFSLNVAINSTENFYFAGMTAAMLTVWFNGSGQAVVSITSVLTNSTGDDVPFETVTKPYLAWFYGTDTFDVAATLPSSDVWTPAVGDTVSFNIVVEVYVPGMSGTVTELSWPDAIYAPEPRVEDFEPLTVL
jgi:hypothetical protein